MQTPLTQRDNSIDILRFIGISCIILAHIGLSNKSALFQIRTFDVPLMIFVSGLAYAGRQTGNYLRFAWKRAKRLIVPVYMFLAIYFLVNFILAQAGVREQIATNKIIGSFALCLSPSIKYVWIIRVFLIIMLLTPPLIKLNDAIKHNWLFVVLIAALFVGQYYLVGWLRPLKLGRAVNDYLLYAVGYSALFLLGLRMRNATLSTKILFTVLLTAAFVAVAFHVDAQKGSWLKMQSFKYPPRVYYLLWGAVASTLLWCTKDWWSRLLDLRPLKFIGQNTICIYLWHIPFIDPVLKLMKDVGWGWRYLTVYALAVGIYSLQYYIVRRIEASRPDKKNAMAKYFKG